MQGAHSRLCKIFCWFLPAIWEEVTELCLSNRRQGGDSGRVKWLVQGHERGAKTPPHGFWLFSEHSLTYIYIYIYMQNIHVKNHIMSVICYANTFFYSFYRKAHPVPIKKKIVYKIPYNMKRYFSDIVPKQMRNVHRLNSLGKKPVPTFSLLDSISYLVSDLCTF